MPHHLVAGTTLSCDVDLGVPVVDAPRPDGWTVLAADAEAGAPGREAQAGRGAVELNRTTQDDGSTWSVLERVGERYVLRFPGLVTFRIDPTRAEVRYDAQDDQPDTLVHLVLDQLAPHLLALGGALVLHAAGVVVEGVAVALVGPSGIGKSTLAGALVRRGALLLADDFLVLDEPEEADARWRARPAYPGLRVWEDSATALGPEAVAGPVSGYSEKQRWRPDPGSVAARPAPLEVVVALAEGAAGRPPALERLPGTAAYMAVFEQAFRVERHGRGRLERELDRFERLVRGVRVHRLEQRYEWAETDAVAALVEGLLA